MAMRGNAKTAVWLPGWYNLDQSVTVGQVSDFIVHADAPDLTELDWLPAVWEVVFFNSLMHPGEWLKCRLKILSIRHHELGMLSSIRTDRFGVYEFVSADGPTYEVEAEQGPGVCYDASVATSDWGAIVEVAEVPDR